MRRSVRLSREEGEGAEEREWDAEEGGRRSSRAEAGRGQEGRGRGSLVCSPVKCISGRNNVRTVPTPCGAYPWPVLNTEGKQRPEWENK